jgi:hypothetical protein
MNVITFTKLFMHVSSRNMFPTIRNLQIRVQVYRPRHCCGDWLTFGCFVPMIADKIWTLSGRLSLVRTIQLMKKMSDASKNIFRLYHIRIIAPKKNGSHDMKQTKIKWHTGY